jgi:hypothetical protein
MATDKEFQTAVLAYAQYLGVDLDHESELIQIARDALEDLPNGWEVCISEEGDSANIPFFHNSYTEESVWHHPQEEVYLRKVKEERRYLKSKNDDHESSKRKDFDKDKNRERERGNDDNIDSRNRDRQDDHRQADEVIDVEDFEEDLDDHRGGARREQSASRDVRHDSAEKDRSRSGRDYSKDRDVDRRRSGSPIFGNNWLPDSVDGGSAEPSRRRGSEGRAASTEPEKGGAYGKKSEGVTEGSSAAVAKGGGSRWDRDIGGGGGGVDDWEGARGGAAAVGGGGYAADRGRAGDADRDVDRKYGNKENGGAGGYIGGASGGSKWGSSPPKQYGHANSRQVESTPGGWNASSTAPITDPVPMQHQHQQSLLWVNTAAETSSTREMDSGRPWTSGHMGGASGVPESTGRLQSEVRRLQDETLSLRSKHKMEVHELELVIESLRSSLQVTKPRV